MLLCLIPIVGPSVCPFASIKQSDLHQIFQSITFENIYENRPRIPKFDKKKWATLYMNKYVHLRDLSSKIFVDATSVCKSDLRWKGQLKNKA